MRQGSRGQETRVQGSRKNPEKLFTFHFSLFTHKGFTLIELIIFIIIAGIFLPATYIAFSSAMRQATQPEDYTRGMLLAEQTMELATKRFSNNFVNNPSQVPADVTAPPTCAAIGVTVPSGYTCTFVPTYVTSLGGLTLSANNYVQLYVRIDTPQNNTFESRGMVTNHAF